MRDLYRSKRRADRQGRAAADAHIKAVLALRDVEIMDPDDYVTFMVSSEDGSEQELVTEYRPRTSPALALLILGEQASKRKRKNRGVSHRKEIA